jgi:hypothetical protein
MELSYINGNLMVLVLNWFWEIKFGINATGRTFLNQHVTYELQKEVEKPPSSTPSCNPIEFL